MCVHVCLQIVGISLVLWGPSGCTVKCQGGNLSNGFGSAGQMTVRASVCGTQGVSSPCCVTVNECVSVYWQLKRGRRRWNLFVCFSSGIRPPDWRSSQSQPAEQTAWTDRAQSRRRRETPSCPTLRSVLVGNCFLCYIVTGFVRCLKFQVTSRISRLSVSVFPKSADSEATSRRFVSSLRFELPALVFFTLLETPCWFIDILYALLCTFMFTPIILCTLRALLFYFEFCEFILVPVFLRLQECGLWLWVCNV